MKSIELEPFIGKRVSIAFESGMFESGTLQYWDGVEVADRRLFLDRPQPAFGVFQSPIPFRPGDIKPNGITVFPA